MQKVNDQVNAGTEHHGVPSAESAIISELGAAPADVADDPLNSILLLLHELTIANAPFPPADCRDIADKIALHVGTARATLTKWKERVGIFQEGYKDESFKVTALEIQLMDLRAHGVDKVTARQNESLRVRLHATSIERNELRDQQRAGVKVLNEYRAQHDVLWRQEEVGRTTECPCGRCVHARVVLANGQVTSDESGTTAER